MASSIGAPTRVGARSGLGVSGPAAVVGEGIASGGLVAVSGVGASGVGVPAVRRSVGHEFPVGIKINSTDKLEGGLTEADALEVVRLLSESSIDIIDISGGTYFPGAAASSDGNSGEGPYFIDFARRSKAVTRR